MFQPRKSPVLGGAAIILLLASSLVMAKPATIMPMGQQHLAHASSNPVTMLRAQAVEAVSWQQYVDTEQAVLHQQKAASSQPNVVAKAKVVTKKTLSPEVIAVQRKATLVKSKVQVASRSNGSDNGLIGFALSLTGIPYKFGGASTSGFDCSAFTQYVYSHYGVKLPRTSFTQFNTGSAVSKGNLQPGDLVFFSTYQKGASHVGIYVGGGNFIHASNSGVRVTAIGGYYANRFVGARRVR